MLSWVLGVLPEPFALRLGEVVGGLAGALGVRRREIERHLRMAFPDESLAWRRRLARRCHRHFGREAVATLRFVRSGLRDVALRSEISGFSDLTAVQQAGAGGIVASAHFGNWEMAGASLAARGILLDVVVRPQRNRLFDEYVNAARRRLGMRVILQEEAPKRILRSLRAGRIVALVADQDARRDGLFVDFMGWAASTARGPALLSIRTGAPLFLGYLLREPGMPQRYRGVLERIEIERTGDRDQDVRALVQAYTRRLESAVRRHPEQYFWHHRRWKTRPLARSTTSVQVEEPVSEADVLSEGRDEASGG